MLHPSSRQKPLSMLPMPLLAIKVLHQPSWHIQHRQTKSKRWVLVKPVILCDMHLGCKHGLGADVMFFLCRRPCITFSSFLSQLHLMSRQGALMFSLSLTAMPVGCK